MCQNNMLCNICAHESVKFLGFLQGFCINSTLYKWFCDIIIIIILNVGLSWTIVIDDGPFLLHMPYKSIIIVLLTIIPIVICLCSPENRFHQQLHKH